MAPPADVERIGIAFLDDIAHNAAPFNSQTGAPLTADTDKLANPVAQPLTEPGTYDNESWQRTLLPATDASTRTSALRRSTRSSIQSTTGWSTTCRTLVTTQNIDVNEWKLPNGQWNGERLFQAARYVTEMEYQHIVFEDFARKIQPGINGFNVFTQSDTGNRPRDQGRVRPCHLPVRALDAD